VENDGYIRGYTALVDHDRPGEGHIAFVQVKLFDTRSAALEAFNRAVLNVAEIEQSTAGLRNLEWISGCGQSFINPNDV
jgi:DNA-binding Lrp family transcriptional regulator